MFAYNPQTQDRSGEIMAAGQIGAAQSNAQAMTQLGSDIGGALASIGGMYGEIESQKAKGRAFKDVFKVVAPSLNMSIEQLEAVAGEKLKSDRDWFNASEMMMPILPSLINLQLGQDRLGVQRDQPFVNAGLQDLRNRAAGNTTYTPPGSPAGADVVEPLDPLPVADETLPAVNPAPAPARSIPGGRASWDAANRRRVARGLDPLPYPDGIQ